MAGITGVAGGDMVAMFASSDITIVAAFTGAGHLRMIHMAHPSPTEGRVTVFTGVARCNMVATLALRGAPIVTGKAVSGDIAVIETGYMPAHRGVAIITFVITADVVHRFTRGVRIIMTAITQHGRACKPPIDMALITLNIAVLTSKRKPGGEMVVIGRYRRRGTTEECAAHYG